MCFHLFLASPLTLSEVRAMLPEGLTADLLGSGEHRTFRDLAPDTRTVARLTHGACSCDLVLQRHPVTREDEAWLRKRYRAQGVPREQVIRALEVHRRALERPPRPPGHWPAAIAGFVAEHARNAGPSFYYLHFSHDGTLGQLPEQEPLHRTAAEVVKTPGEWLGEETVVVVG